MNGEGEVLVAFEGMLKFSGWAAAARPVPSVDTSRWLYQIAWRREEPLQAAASKTLRESRG